MLIDAILYLAEIIYKIILAVVSIAGGTFLIIKASKSEAASQKYFLMGMGAFGYVFALARIFFVLSDLSGDILINDFLFLIWWRLATVSSILMLVVLEIIVETYVVKTKYIFTVVATVGTILVTFLIKDLTYVVQLIVVLVCLLNIAGAYVYVAYKSTGEVRRKAIFSLAGIMTLVVGVFLEGSMGSGLLGFDTGFLGVTFMLIGILVYFGTNQKY